MNSAILDPSLNRAPEKARRIHLIGVCGAGMAALAAMFNERGFEVSGSDAQVYPPMSDFLASQRIPVMEGYAARNLHPHPDLVIVGNVVRAVNPEAIELARLGLPYLSMPQALAHFFLEGKKPLVVCGTHGKTTTASLLASCLHRLGETPGFMIGGLVEAFGRNYGLSNSPYFVIEGDEYDTAFFNKVSKFHHYRPAYAICTSVEFDHADIFANLDAVKATFAQFIQRLPASGALIAHLDDPILAALSKGAKCAVVDYGVEQERLWRLELLEVRGLHSEFAIYRGQALQGKCRLPMPGRHNCLNALAVIALLHHLGYPVEAVCEALSHFEGVKRRQQIRGQAAGVTVVDDFAHHPSAVRETLHALRLAWPNSRLIAVFEPRTNSSRRSVFQQEYASAFGHADLALIRAPLPLDNIQAEQQFSALQLARDLHRQGVKAQAFASTEEILDYLSLHTQNGDKVIILSNGGFDDIHERLLTRLRQKKQSA